LTHYFDLEWLLPFIVGIHSGYLLEALFICLMDNTAGIVVSRAVVKIKIGNS
jgi:hypothetical protein